MTERLPTGAATPAGLLMVKLLNVEAPTACGTVPLNVTVPKPGVNVPLRTQSPPTEMFAAPLWRAVPLPITTFPATAMGAWTTTALLELRVRFPATVAGLDRVATPADLLNARS